MENFILKWVGQNSSVAGLPFLERGVERSKPRVVCPLALGPVDAVNVTTILSLFDNNEVFCLYRHYIYTQKFTN
jgi:hypothetical protein